MQNLNRQQSEPNPENRPDKKSSTSIKQKSDPYIALADAPAPANQPGSTPDIHVAPPTATASVADHTPSTNSMHSASSGTNYQQPNFIPENEQQN